MTAKLIIVVLHAVTGTGGGVTGDIHINDTDSYAPPPLWNKYFDLEHQQYHPSGSWLEENSTT